MEGVGLEMTDSIEEAGDDIKDIIAAMGEVEWVGPTKVAMIPEYYNYIMNDDIEPLLEKIEEARKEEKKLKVIWLE